MKGMRRRRGKWLGHYSSTQSILLVGEGNFSFSLALATAFGSGANLVATSLDTYEVLIGKYSNAKSNVMKLETLETTVLYGVDVKRMKFHTDLVNRRFDRIVFNFPHAGFKFKGREDQVHMINLHKKLVRGFFRSAHYLLQPYGEIHVSHKTGASYDRWEIERLAAEFSLVLVEKVGFQKADYPGYSQKKGDGPNCNKPFKLGACCTFKFKFKDLKKRKKRKRRRTRPISSVGDLLISIYGETMQHPGFPLNLDGTAISPCFHLQCPMLSMPRSSLNDLGTPSGIPSSVGRIKTNTFLAPQGLHSTNRLIAGPLRRTGHFFAQEYQRSLQREYKMPRQTSHREFV